MPGLFFKEDSTVKIEINERQLSAHASPIEAQQLVAELVAINWPCVYVDKNTPACWDFDGEQYILNAFELDFELISEELWPTDGYSWQVVPENFPDLDKAPGEFL